MVISLERGADLHTPQPMPLPLTARADPGICVRGRPSPLPLVGPLKPRRDLGSAVSSPSRVRGGAPEKEFGAL